MSEFISSTEASTMVNAYRETIGANDTIAFDLEASPIQELLATPEATGLRAYLCLDETGKIDLLLTSIKSDGFETVDSLTLDRHHKRKSDDTKLFY